MRPGSTRFVVSLAACLLAVPLIAAAQTPPPQGGQQRQPPPPPKNLQVFPKDIQRPQLIAAMGSISQALGVRCSYCHIDDEPGRQNDFASDEKPTKMKARQMMLLVREINEKVPTAVSKSAADTTRVGCVTCHRGVAIPKQLGDILTETAKAGGTDAAIAKYRDLRKQYYGAQAYDFSENGLVFYAQRQVQADKADDALTYLKLNLEFYPQSARTYLAMAQAYNRKSDKADAIKSAEKALEIDPQNAAAKRQLDQLKGTGQ